MKPKLLLLYAFAAAAYLFADPVNLSIEEAVELASVNSPAIQDQGTVVAKALLNKENSWNLFLPGITADLTGRFGEAIFFPPGRPTSPLASSLKMDMKLTLDTKTLYDLEKRGYDYTSALIVAQEAQRKLVVVVEKDYFSLLASSMDINNSLRTLSLDEELYRQTKVKFERGLESELALLNADLKRQVSQAAVTNSRAGYEKKASVLKRSLGLDPQTSLVLTTPLVIKELDSGKLESLMDAIEERLDLEIKRRSIQAAAVAAERYHAVNRLPLVTLGSSLSFSLSDFSIPLDGFAVSASLSFAADAWIPGSQKDLAYAALKGEIDQQALEYDRMLKAAREKVEDLVADLSLKINDLRLTEAKLALASRIYTQTADAYNRGTVTQSGLDDAQNKVELQRQALVTSQLAYLHLVIDVGYALGVDWRSLVDSASLR